MKKLFLCFALMLSAIAFAQVGIGTTTPHSSSILDLTATDKALILPRVANSNAIVSPVNGMVIYDTGKHCYRGYANGAWVNITTCPATLTVASPTYQGVSVINTTGIGYNGEAVPAASTITVQVTTDEPNAPYTLTATDATTGLTYSASGTLATPGTYPVVLTHNAPTMPEFFSGVITMPLTGASNSINLAPRIDVKSIPASATAVVDVTFGTQTWMDRNLGARRVATALNDVFSYGNHYQWGRPADGHEISVWNGETLTTGRGFYDATALESLATSDTPGHPNFILTNVTPYDWRSDNNNNRWATSNQGPCPAGYHVPTKTDWETADTFGAWNNNTNTYNSALKIPSSGQRNRLSGSLSVQGTGSRHWSTTISGTTNNILLTSSLNSSATTITTIINRANGFSVRCIKD